MRLKRLLALAGMLAVMAGASAGTLALFSDSAAPADGTVTAGTLALNSFRDQGDTVPGPMFYTTPAEGETPGGAPGLLPTGPWAPGDTHHRVLIVQNVGSLDAWLTGVGADMQPGGSTHLAQKLEVKVTTDSAGLNVLSSGTMQDFINTDQSFASNLSLNAGPVPRALHFWVTLPLDADNTYQNETLLVDFHVLAEQKKNNP